jgi:hypothetical protein
VPLDQLQQHLEPVFRRQFSIELVVGPIRIFEIMEHLNDAVHGRQFSMRRAIFTTQTKQPAVAASRREGQYAR